MANFREKSRTLGPKRPILPQSELGPLEPTGAKSRVLFDQSELMEPFGTESTRHLSRSHVAFGSNLSLFQKSLVLFDPRRS